MESIISLETNKRNKFATWLEILGFSVIFRTPYMILHCIFNNFYKFRFCPKFFSFFASLFLSLFYVFWCLNFNLPCMKALNLASVFLCALALLALSVSGGDRTSPEQA